MLVRDFMIPLGKVVTCLRTDTVESVIDKLLGNKISAVVVVEEEKAVGIVTKTDVVRAYKIGLALDSNIECLMSTKLKTVQHNIPGDKAATIFETNTIHHAIVIGSSDEFVGLISSWDIARECVLDAKAWPWHREVGGRVTIKH